jgi:hypothetical protein
VPNPETTPDFMHNVNDPNIIETRDVGNSGSKNTQASTITYSESGLKKKVNIFQYLFTIAKISNFQKGCKLGKTI